jgi:hypothetical protein
MVRGSFSVIRKASPYHLIGAQYLSVPDCRISPCQRFISLKPIQRVSDPYYFLDSSSMKMKIANNFMKLKPNLVLDWITWRPMFYPFS